MSITLKIQYIHYKLEREVRSLLILNILLHVCTSICQYIWFYLFRMVLCNKSDNHKIICTSSKTFDKILRKEHFYKGKYLVIHVFKEKMR